MIFWARSQIGPDGEPRLDFGENRTKVSAALKKSPGARWQLVPWLPESRRQRKFFEGALIPFICYFQENLDWQDPDDLKYVREGLKIEFNATFVVIGDKSIKVPKSTRGELNRGFLERVLDWAGEQGYPIELLNTPDYKKWRDQIFPHGGPKTYIEYLIETGKLLPRREYEDNKNTSSEM